MKTIFMTLLLLSSFSIFAAKVVPSKTPPLDSNNTTKVIPTAAPGASGPALKNTQPEATAPVAQKQETKPGIDNPYPIGDYDKNGEYNFFDRLEQEKRSAQEEKSEQEQ